MPIYRALQFTVFLLVNGALTENITSNSYFIIKCHINVKFHTFIKALNHY